MVPSAAATFDLTTGPRLMQRVAKPPVIKPTVRPLHLRIPFPKPSNRLLPFMVATIDP
jgi:hypothetical protein